VAAAISKRYIYIDSIDRRSLVLDFAILGLLREQPRHGYELKCALGDLGFWQISFGSLYPALRRLEKQRFIEAAKGEGPRKAYRVTEPGRIRFGEMLAGSGDASDRDFQLRLAFLGYVEPESRLAVLEGPRTALQERLHGARRSFRGARSGTRNPDRYRMALMERSVRSTEADIAWLDELIAGERSATAGA
jgi:DNA-binding PadR family transcriptional regulator